MGFGISISWNSFRHTDGEQIINEIKSVGFNEIELSFNLPSQTLEEIYDSFCQGGIKVLSVHNFCPIPDGLKREEALPDFFSIASCNEQSRKKAIIQAKKSIDTASRFHAKAVVLHSGRVEIPDKTKDLIRLYDQGLKNKRVFVDLRNEIKKERKEKAAMFFERTLKSLEEINRYAVSNDICLGIETRNYYREIPSFDEIGIILKEFKGSNIFYWHDCGHAQIMENLGFFKHSDFLLAYGRSMIGMHIHDVVGCSDHIAPFTGEIDFTLLKPYFRENMIKIIEAHHPETEDNLRKSKSLLEEMTGGSQ